MKKISKLSTIVGVAGLLCAAGNAMAVTKTNFYGLFDVFAGSEKPVGSSTTTKLDSSGMSTSYLGASISTEVAPGVTGIAAVEAFMRPATGDIGRFSGDQLFARDAYLGVKGKYGKLTAGRNTSPYFLSVIFYNPFVDSFVFSPAILQTYLGSLDGDTGWSNSLVYSTPKMGAFNGSLAYAKPGTTGVYNASATLFYNSGKLSGTLTAERIGVHTNSNVPTGNVQKSALLGVSYDMGVVKLFGEYQTMDNSGTAGDAKQKLGQIGASIPAGKGAVLISYARTKGTGAMDFTRKTRAIGYDYNVSKALDVYVAYMHDDVSGTATGGWSLGSTGTGETYGLGARYQF